MPQNIILVGPMGAGKTTIGRQIAKALGRDFYDSDKEVEKRTGATIPLIFELEKEEGFRLRESAMIKELLSKDSIVLATGGGAVLSEKNRKYMSNHGFVIYLCAPLEQLVRRTARDKNRPLLQTKNPKKTIEELLTKRDPLYREVADIVIETDGFTVRQVVSKLQKIIKGKNL
ncbi:MAG: shikimate kinase AroK [Gammaproteobacteria bacterium]|nr:shikimate kinase AroK [Gammaproteobacteria bacterium]